MKEIHIRRHAEKNTDGNLTENGIQAARELSKQMPKFNRVIASDSSRTQLTAKLLTGIDPLVDVRFGYAAISPGKIDAIERLALKNGISFLEAVNLYRDLEIIEGIESKAGTLNQLIDEYFNKPEENRRMLIVSHEITIIPAMAKRGISLQSIKPLGGFVLKADGSIKIIE